MSEIIKARELIRDALVMGTMDARPGYSARWS